MVLAILQLIRRRLKHRRKLTSQDTIHKFANDINAELTVMKNGEHWFHTAEQMAFLDDWIRKYK